MKTHNTKAIVLGRIKYGETDKIVTLLTKDQGKVSVIAKGVRKPKSKLAGGIELFTVSDVSFLDSQKELKTLVSARASVFYGNIIKDLLVTQSAYQLLKDVNAYTESLCEEEYYNVLTAALNGLHNKISPAIVQAWFAVRLLALSGHAINTQVQSSSDVYVFSVQETAFLPHESGTYTQNHIKLLRLMSVSGIEKLVYVQNIQHYAADILPLLQQLIKIYNNKNL